MQPDLHHFTLLRELYMCLHVHNINQLLLYGFGLGTARTRAAVHNVWDSIAWERGQEGLKVWKFFVGLNYLVIALH